MQRREEQVTSYDEASVSLIETPYRRANCLMTKLPDMAVKVDCLIKLPDMAVKLTASLTDDYIVYYLYADLTGIMHCCGY